MFSVHCPNHGAEVLLPQSRITGIRNTTNGIEVQWKCFCGSEGSYLTGRRVSERNAAQPAA